MGTLHEAQSHIGLAAWAGPRGMKATIGAIDLVVLEKQETLGANPQATRRASPHLRRVLGRAGGTHEQCQARRRRKNSRKATPLPGQILLTVRAPIGRVEDALSTSRAAANKQKVALGAKFGTRRIGEITTRAGKGQGQAAVRAGLLVVLIGQRTPAARAVHLTAGGADPIVQKDAGPTCRAASGIGMLKDGIIACGFHASIPSS
jgi:hypothetical protein